MKKILYFIILFPILALGQTTTENFVKTTKYKSPTTTSIANPLPSQAVQDITYLDGLGRPIQQVANQQSNTGKDIVLPIAYDAFGRQEKQYLPYIRTTASLDYDSSAITNVSTFYSNPTLSNTGNPSFEATTNPYSQTLFESSPLSRVLESASPGNDWEISDHHTVRMEYLFSTSTDNVKIYKVTASLNPSSGLYDIPLTDSGFYTANKLYKNVVKNENWKTGDGDTNTTQEFRNNQGQLVLKRIFGESIINGTPNIVAHDTYYVYDQFGNLTYVIPPLVDTNNTITQDILNTLCYQYKYDYRNRLVEKKLPEKQWEYIIYDKLDRVVATGPSLAPFADRIALNKTGWIIFKYDVLNRVVCTGWQESTVVIDANQRYLKQDIQNNLTTTLNETKQAIGSIDGIAAHYSNVVSPTTYKLLSVNFYDNYTFTDAPPSTSFPTTVLNDASQQVYYNNSTLKPIGLPTGNWTRTLQNSTNINGETSYILYDNKARAVRTYKKNYLGGYTQVDSKIDFSGKVLYSETKHKRIATSTEIYTRDDFTYSDQDRLLTHTQKIGTTGTPQLLSKNTYDELGQLITKRVGGTDITGIACLQKVDYAYNIRGWLKEINKTGGDPSIDPTPLNISGEPNDLFAFKINYQDNNKTATYAGENLVEPLYNGNISETFWRTSSDNVNRKYGYTYDDLNRLKSAVYEKPYTTSPVTNMYNESLSYDKNGNIMSLQRNGDFDAQSGPIPIDILEYNYFANSNRLRWVKETSTNNGTLGFKDGSNLNTANGDPTQFDYAYDANGNMITDRNKAINTASTTPIKYNHLNLPTEIIFTNTPTVKKINYLYSASGNKLQKIVTNGTSVVTTDYLDGYQYKGAVLQYFPHAEGYVNFDSGVYKHVFNYTDHLGNIRVSYSKDDTTGLAVIMEQNHYYPFGLKHTNYNVNVMKLRGSTIEPTLANPNKYKYNGKEFQDELGLNMTSMDFRLYDNSIGRFNVVDPLAEIDHNMSPYVFSRNNSVYFNDPTGLNSDYEDGDDTDWNAGLVGVDDSYRAPGFGGGFVTQNDMTSGDPMGGELREAVVGNTYKEGYDKNGTIDNDVDEWEGTYFDRDNRGSGAYGWNDGSAERVWNKYMPITSSFYTFYTGLESGNKGQAVLGLGLLVIDIFTLGEGSLAIKGAGKLATTETYALKAAESGFYPVMTRGFKNATELVYLEAGQVWKYGVTKNPLTRYSEKYLRNLGEYGVYYDKIYKGTRAEALQIEQMGILNHIEKHGVLPAGNKVKF